MLRLMETFARQIAARSARPRWTLLAVSCLISAALVITLRSIFD